MLIYKSWKIAFSLDVKGGGNKLHLTFNWPHISKAVAGGGFCTILCGQSGAVVLD